MTMPRMRNAIAVLTVVVACVASAGTERDRAKSAAGAVLNQFGTADKLNSNGLEPMSTDKPMKTVDGQNFEAQVTCPGSQRFLRLTFFPNDSNDIDRLAVDLDTNFDGTTDYSRMFVGPYPAICSNGLVQCPAGTTDNCSYWRWRGSASDVRLDNLDDDGMQNTQQDLGACYCVNNSCGANLLMTNSQKVLSDIGIGIARAMQASYPRLTVARTEQVDPVTAVFYGQMSGCGSDSSPEQYYRDPGAMGGAGQAIANDPNSTYHFLLESDAAQQHGYEQSSCELNREITLKQIRKEDILSVVSRTRGSTQDCGPGCYRFVIGVPGAQIYEDDGCARSEEKLKLQVHYPELVESATLTEVGYNDLYVSVLVNGQYVFDARPRSGCSTRREGVQRPNIDITSRFRNTAPGATLEAKNELVYSDEDASGWSIIETHVRESCSIKEERIGNACAAAENNKDCRLKDEWVDDVQTVRDYYSTGLTALPSSRTVTDNGCAIAVERPWWKTKRIYSCRSGRPPYDGADARRRYESVHSSFDPDNGSYTDERKTDGNWSRSAESLSLPAPDEVQACTPTCKTRKPRPGSAMTQDGAVSQQNNSGVAWDYTYKPCDEANSCPLEAGEEVLSTCDCRSNFTEAFTMMQSIRMVGQDFVCTSGP